MLPYIQERSFCHPKCDSLKTKLIHLNQNIYILIEIDANLISWFDLDDLVVRKVGVDHEHSLLSRNPAYMQFEVGLKRVNNDESVMEMARLGVKFRAVALYVPKVGDDVELDRDLTTRVPKFSFRRAGKRNVEYKKTN